MHSTKCIENLPRDVLVEIFSYISFNDLVHSVQYVSCFWREVAQDTQLWRRLLYNPTEDVQDDEIVKILQQTPKLQTLLLDKREVCSPVLNSVLENCSDLKKVEFSYVQQLSLKSLKELVQHCKNLEHLSIPSRNIKTLESANIIGQFQNLISLNFVQSFHHVPPLLLKPIADGCPSLQNIDLGWTNFRSDDLEYLLRKKQHQLRSLQVSCFAEDGKCILPLLTVCKTLKTLVVLGWCNINVTEWVEALTSLKSVTSLTLPYLDNANIPTVTSLFSEGSMSQLVELRFGHITMQGEYKLVDAICVNCPQLKVLGFTYCSSVGDRSLQNLCTLNELEHLTLEFCGHITDGGMEFILKCQHLQYLSLMGFCNLTEKSLKRLINLNMLQVLKLDYSHISGLPLGLIPTHLPKLTLLNVNCCDGVDSEALEKLKAAMPGLTIEHLLEEEYSEQDMKDGSCIEDREVLVCKVFDLKSNTPR